MLRLGFLWAWDVDWGIGIMILMLGLGSKIKEKLGIVRIRMKGWVQLLEGNAKRQFCNNDLGALRTRLSPMHQVRVRVLYPDRNAYEPNATPNTLDLQNDLAHTCWILTRRARYSYSTKDAKILHPSNRRR